MIVANDLPRRQYIVARLVPKRQRPGDKFGRDATAEPARQGGVMVTDDPNPLVIVDQPAKSHRVAIG